MKGPSVCIAAIGDVGIIGKVAGFVDAEGPDALLADVRHLFNDADLTVFNLEKPFVRSDAPRPAHVPETSRVDPARVAALDFPGIRIACLANNHVMDFGQAGLDCTLETLDERGIRHVGVGTTPDNARTPIELEISGLRLGVLAYATEGPHSADSRPGAARARPDEMESDIRALRSRVEFLVVNLHSGQTYLDLPSPAERELKRGLAQAGADLVLGHHPHVMQGVERVGKSLVAHSLGEFVYDGTVGNVVARHATERRRQTVVLLVRFGPEGLRDFRLEPVWSSDVGRPEPAREREPAMRERLARLDALLEADDYERLFRDNASQNLVGHETRVVLRAIQRADFRYLAEKVSRIRPRHVQLLLHSLKRRLARKEDK